MKNKLLFVLVLLVSVTGFAYQIDLTGAWPFSAPSVVDEGDVTSVTVAGDIVYDETEKTFYGRKDGSNWTDLGATGTLDYQINKLSTDVTTAQTVTDLGFSNLTIGKHYRLTMNASLNVGGGSNCSLTAVHDSSSILRAHLGTNSGTSVSGSHTQSIIFEATTTSLTFSYSIGGGSATLQGANDTLETYVMIEEIPSANEVSSL